MEARYIPPVQLGWDYPEDVQVAARSAALLEIQWRLQDHIGRPMYPGYEQAWQWQARAALGRYTDILSTYWWAVYADPITHAIVVSIVTDDDYRKQPDLAPASRYQRVSDVGSAS